MKRIRPAFVALATFLAVLLPLEQSHCAWMGVMSAAPRADTRASHACCRDGAAPAPAPRPTADCACMKLPSGSLPTPVVAGGPTLGAAALVASPSLSTPLIQAEAPAPALDVGSPPLPVDLGAHGLRAPPRSA